MKEISISNLPKAQLTPQNVTQHFTDFELNSQHVTKNWIKTSYEDQIFNIQQTNKHQLINSLFPKHLNN